MDASPNASDGRGSADERKQGGTLVIRAVPGRGPRPPARDARIIERINAFYGYGAIAAVKIVQAPLKPASPRRRPSPTLDARRTPRRSNPSSRTVADPALKEALQRLGTGALASRSSTGQMTHWSFRLNIE